MTTTTPVTESPLDPADAVYSHVCPAGDGWLHKIEKGQTLRIVDMEGEPSSGYYFLRCERSNQSLLGQCYDCWPAAGVFNHWQRSAQ